MLTKSRLAAMYGISRPTLNKRLKEIGMYKKGYSLFTPQQILKLYEIWGDPAQGHKKSPFQD